MWDIVDSYGVLVKGGFFSYLEASRWAQIFGPNGYSIVKYK